MTNQTPEQVIAKRAQEIFNERYTVRDILKMDCLDAHMQCYEEARSEYYEDQPAGADEYMMERLAEIDAAKGDPNAILDVLNKAYDDGYTDACQDKGENYREAKDALKHRSGEWVEVEVKRIHPLTGQPLKN